jgi:hypothetical protein
MPTEGRERGSPSSDMSDQSAKKQRVEQLPNGSAVKQEVVVHDAAGGAVVAQVNGSRVEVTLKMDISVLHCPLCFCPLRPPVHKVRSRLSRALSLKSDSLSRSQLRSVTV